MAKAIDTLSIKLDLGGLAGGQALIDKLKSSFKGLEQVISGNTAPAIRKLRQQVNDFAAQGNRSINTIESQVTALRALRREADINSKEFKELTADIKKYETQLSKVQGRSRGGGGGALRATQTAGAVVSGGIFGGPEGAIGALLGAPFGVPGAFAGAAIGAQVGGVRQSVAGTADYAAQIEKLKIALEGVAGGTNNYNSALVTARQVTESLNVPQDQAIKGITRLTAAVRGAGGPVADAETTFRNVTAAIKATGGSSEDVQGAITAMVQVFSKGKVSAEELSGQLGERLPGAVTMFAKANDMTLPELQKNLKAGTVGLNELMNFIVELGDEYGGTAEKIADSNAEAGARLTVAIKNMQAEIGTALIPIGAQFQEAFAEFITTITPALKESLPVIGKLLLTITENLKTLAVAAATAISVLAVAKIAAIVSSIGSLSAAIFTLKLNVIVATKALAGLNAVALLNPYVALAAGAALLAANVFKAAQEQKRLNILIKEGTVSEVDAEIVRVRSQLDEAILSQPKGAAGMMSAQPARVTALRKTLSRLEARREAALYDQTQGADLPSSLLQRFDYGTPSTEGTTATGGKTKARVDMSSTELDIRKEIIEARRQEDVVLAANLQYQLDIYQALKNNKGENDLAFKTLQAREKLEQTLGKYADNDIKRLTKKQELEKQLNRELRVSLEDRQYQLGLISEEQNIENQIRREREALQEKGASEEQIKQQTDLLKKILTETPIDKFIRDATKSLTDLQSRAVSVAQAIGDAVGQALSNGIQSLIEGTSSVKEQFANLLKSIGQILIQEGTKMIATYISIGIARAFAGFGTSSLGFSNSAAASAQSSFASFFQGFTARANGGPVQSGRPYLVGEQGPELFLPSQSGRVKSNEDMRRLMGRSPASAATQMNFTFETTNIGGTEYVSREQLELAMATTRRQAANDGATRGMNMTLDRMQNSPRTRARVGIA